MVAEFAEKVKEKGPNSVALVYYAGHGLQVDGDNYLVPVDAKFEKQEDVAEQGVRLADVIATLATAQSKALIFILDACRNNPFSSLNDVAGKGLAIVDAPAGSIIAYSTAPGTEAFDGQGTHSPYAAALMRTVKTPNLPIEQVFKKVRVLVDDTTNSKQMPWESSSLTTDFVFFTNASLDTAATPVAPKVEVAQLRTRSVEQAYRGRGSGRLGRVLRRIRPHLSDASALRLHPQQAVAPAADGRLAQCDQAEQRRGLCVLPGQARQQRPRQVREEAA